MAIDRRKKVSKLHKKHPPPSSSNMPCLPLHFPSTLLPLTGICQEKASICSLRGFLCPPRCRPVPEVRQSRGGSMATLCLARKWDMDPGGELRLISFGVSVSWCEFSESIAVRQGSVREDDRAAPAGERNRYPGW
ncbi:unnamed protein product [Pleuronectes platessa]|uniref:Uncharacterized protein n=1 Tax=Pleuronectes platessa TaxID=8262 RepID=A0A9N7TSW1_PLEPL|nr:unnamed protein product [Pleuronectes platessa]